MSSGDRDVTGLRGDSLDPRLDLRVAREVETALACDMRVGVERDVRDREAAGKEVAPVRKAALKTVEGRIAAFLLLLEGLRRRRHVVEDPVPRDGDVRLVAVLLEEHPLQRLRPVVRVSRHVRSPVGEVPEDRVGLSEAAAVLQHHRGDAEARVEIAENLLAVRPVHDGERPAFVLDAEEGEEEPNLVTVARDRRVVEDDGHQSPFVPGIQSVPASGTLAMAAASTVRATRSSGSRLWTWDLPQARARVCVSSVRTRR